MLSIFVKNLKGCVDKLFWIPNREVDNRHTISSLHQRLSSILYQYHQCHPEEQYRVPQAGGRIRTQPPLLHARPCYCRDALRCSRQQTARHTEYLRAQTADRRDGIFPALVSVKQAIYDNNGSGSMSTTMHNGTKPSVYDMTYDAYLPYGELLVDEHTSSEDMPYKFNGKELDQETGLYYYGARYMNPVTSLWYGVDALAENIQALVDMFTVLVIR